MLADKEEIFRERETGAQENKRQSWSKKKKKKTRTFQRHTRAFCKRLSSSVKDG